MNASRQSSLPHRCGACTVVRGATDDAATSSANETIGAVHRPIVGLAARIAEREVDEDEPRDARLLDDVAAHSR